MQGLTSVMPGDAAKLVGEQLMNVVKTSGSKKGLGLLLALALAVFGARSAAGSIVTALNIAYEEKEKRSFIMVNLLALGITAAGVVFAVLAVVAIAALGHLESLLPTAPAFVVILRQAAVLRRTGARGCGWGGDPLPVRTFTHQTALGVVDTRLDAGGAAVARANAGVRHLRR